MYGIYIDRSSSLPVTRQLCNQLRERIESGQLAAGTKLLPTRVLAKDWGIARNVVIEVYEQLTAEGYLDCRVGSGTYVADGIIPSAAATVHPVPAKMNPSIISPEPPDRTLIDFATGIPDLNRFPGKIWAKYLKEAAESSPHEYNYGDVKGSLSLRLALRDYLFRSKGISCSADQLIIVSGASEGFLLLAKALSAQFDSIYLEDPTIDIARDIFRMMNYSLIPVQVDSNGMQVNAIRTFLPGHLLLLTPSHQFPSGSLMPIQRRHQAIRMAEEADAYVIEDDYDSEFRLKGIPVPPLQILSPSRVIYVGTFSKTLSPSLRIGFLIAPPKLMDAITLAKDSLNLHTPAVIQTALAAFIRDGQLERHIHTMKKLYKKRRNLLTERLVQAFGDEISITGDEAGMHLQVLFHTQKHADLPWNDTSAYGFRVERSEDYRIGDGSSESGIVLGYGNLASDQITEGVSRMHRFVSAFGESM